MPRTHIESLEPRRLLSAGDLDPTFSGDGKQTTDFALAADQANAIAVQSNGRVVVAGSALISSHFQVAITRYNADGSLDTSFGPTTSGEVLTPFKLNSRANGIAI